MSYGPPPPPGGGYGPPDGNPAVPQRTSPLAIASLVTGILGIVPCCGLFVVSIAAMVTGYLGRARIEASGGAEKGLRLAQVGFVLGVVGAALSIIYWILVATHSIHIGYNGA